MESLTFTASSGQKIVVPMSKRTQWIKGQLKKQRMTLASIGREYKVTGQAVSVGINRRSLSWIQIIADKLDIPVEELWPDVVDENGLPLPDEEVSA
tara:strand:- start:687 stop:974 length:288 start_codon:yes stop_codon:yes gene_type:complete